MIPRVVLGQGKGHVNVHQARDAAQRSEPASYDAVESVEAQPMKVQAGHGHGEATRGILGKPKLVRRLTAADGGCRSGDVRVSKRSGGKGMVARREDRLRGRWIETGGRTATRAAD